MKIRESATSSKGLTFDPGSLTLASVKKMYDGLPTKPFPNAVRCSADSLMALRSSLHIADARSIPDVAKPFIGMAIIEDNTVPFGKYELGFLRNGEFIPA